MLKAAGMRVFFSEETLAEVGNVSQDAAKAEVEKAKRGKIPGGCRPAPCSKILTMDARSHLAASLGVTDP